MLFGIYVRRNFSPCGVDPSIAIGVIRVAVSIEQLRHRVRAKIVESLHNPWLRHAEP